MPRTLPIALLAARAAAPRLERARRQERIPRRDPPHHRRRPPRQGARLRLARLRLRLRVRAGPALRVRDIIVTVSAQRSRYFGSDGRVAQRRHQPAVGLLLAADPRRADGRAARQAQARRTARRRRCARHIKGFAAGYNAYLRKTGPRQAARPDLPRQGVGAPDHDARRLPPLLPARPARELGQLPARDRQRRAAGRRGRLAPGPPRCRPPEQLQRAARRRPGARHRAPARLQRLRRRLGRHARRALRAARQPALPLAGLRALVRDAPHRSPASSTRSAPACRACRWSTSASTSTSRGATPSRPRAASRRTSSSSSPATRRSYLVDGKAVKMKPPHRLGAHAVRRPAAHVLRDALGAGVRLPGGRPDLGRRERLRARPTSTRTTSA